MKILKFEINENAQENPDDLLFDADLLTNEHSIAKKLNDIELALTQLLEKNPQ